MVEITPKPPAKFTVKIIPKPPAKLPLWQNILFCFSLTLLIGAICSYFVFDYSQKKAEETFKNLKTTLEEEKTLQRIVLETEVLNAKKKINGFSQLLDKHISTSNIFSLLEKKSLPKIWFTNFNFDFKDYSVIISGETDSFYTLGQQLLILKKEKLIEKIGLSGVSISQEGNILFTFNLSLSPETFKYD